MASKVLQFVLVMYFAGISLLGSSGLHTLMGLSHGHLHGVVGVAHKDESHSHHCKHHHHHSNAVDESQPRHHHHDDSTPEHDCPICDWASQPIADLTPPPVELTLERPVLRPLASEVVAPCAALVTPPARGPPTVG